MCPVSELGWLRGLIQWGCQLEHLPMVFPRSQGFLTAWRQQGIGTSNAMAHDSRANSSGKKQKLSAIYDLVLEVTKPQF